MVPESASNVFGPLSRQSFKAIANAVEAETGIRLPPAKQTMVEGRLRKRVRALGLSDLDDYAAYALDPAQQQGELIHLIDCVTTNKTDFFREPLHFSFLQDVAIPALLRRQSRKPAKIKVWSGACSTGAEAYTIAMVLQDMQGVREDFHYSILGTDISTEVLAEARAAIYSRAMMEPVPVDKRLRYVMTPRDRSRDKVRIVPELRRKVQFQRLNLMDERYPFDGDIDVIFCRNVLIYFEKAIQRAVIERLVSHLRPGGYLLLGHSETMAGTEVQGLRHIRPSILQAVHAGINAR